MLKFSEMQIYKLTVHFCFVQLGYEHVTFISKYESTEFEGSGYIQWNLFVTTTDFGDQI